MKLLAAIAMLLFAGTMMMTGSLLMILLGVFMSVLAFGGLIPHERELEGEKPKAIDLTPELAPEYFAAIEGGKKAAEEWLADQVEMDKSMFGFTVPVQYNGKTFGASVPPAVKQKNEEEVWYENFVKEAHATPGVDQTTQHCSTPGRYSFLYHGETVEFKYRDPLSVKAKAFREAGLTVEFTARILGEKIENVKKVWPKTEDEKLMEDINPLAPLERRVDVLVKKGVNTRKIAELLGIPFLDAVRLTHRPGRIVSTFSDMERVARIEREVNQAIRELHKAGESDTQIMTKLGLPLSRIDEALGTEVYVPRGAAASVPPLNVRQPTHTLTDSELALLRQLFREKNPGQRVMLLPEPAQIIAKVQTDDSVPELIPTEEVYVSELVEKLEAEQNRRLALVEREARREPPSIQGKLARELMTDLIRSGHVNASQVAAELDEEYEEAF